jgi:tetratricopeptide (TPR) repeat protein
MRNGQRVPEGERRAANLKAIEVLTALSTEGPATYARKALSTLASLRFQQGDYTAAREDYRRYVERYAQSDYAWVAALRLGEIAAVLGDWPAAHRSFEEAARVYASNPLARIMARALAGNAAEAIGQPERALDHYDAALGAWDRDYRLEVPLQTASPAANLLDAVLTAPRLVRADLTGRAVTLRATLPQPGGALLERGRWLLTRKDWTAAAAAFEELIARDPASSLVPEARLLLHRTQLEKALDLANDERSATNAAAAATMLDALEREPFDVAVAAARIARASLLSTQGKSKAAEAAMSSALTDWLQRQTLQQPGTPIERDVAAIREVVFKPMGGGIFAEAGGRNAFEWPGRLPRFLVIDPEVELKLPSGDTTSVSIAAAIPGLDNVLYADSTVLSLLDMTLNSLGGTRRRQSTPIMETPNQPVGQSMKIIALWTKFFPARPGHWGGWEFTSYPRLTRIEFLDAAHTKAAAAVTVGYSGATIVLEKQGATWKLVKVTNHWMT